MTISFFFLSFEAPKPMHLFFTLDEMTVVDYTLCQIGSNC